MSLPDRVRLFLYDSTGRRAISCLNVKPATTGGALAVGITLLEALTPCVINAVRRDQLQAPPTGLLGGTGAYSGARDIVTLDFTMASGSTKHPVSLAGLLPGILKPDHWTVDKSQTDVAAAIAWILANCTDDNGDDLAGYYAGYRWYLNRP